MFRKAQHIDTAFRHIRAFCILVIVLNALTFCYYTYRSDKRVERAENKALILLNGQVVKAMVSDRQTNLPVELKDHVKVFHQYFFSLSPDDKAIQETITQALYLADASAMRNYDNLKENGYYGNIISGNISQRVKVDSVVVSTDDYPYPFRCYATQQLVRSTSTARRSLITTGYLREVNRSDNNPHGFLIERWEILENKDISNEQH